jgi:hypothetical protein
MRAIISLVFIVLLLCLAVFALTVFLDPSKTYDFFASLSGSETLEKHPLELYVPSKMQFKISFPARRPAEMVFANSFLRQTPLPFPQYYVADREVGFFATEYGADLSGVLSTAPHNTGLELKADRGANDPLYFAAAQTGAKILATQSDVAVVQERYALDPLSLQSFLDTSCEGLILKYRGTITSKIPDSLGGGSFPGRYVEGTFKNTGNAFRLRLFLDQRRRRLVAACVVGKTKRVYSTQATKFLNSLYMWSS